MCIEDESKVMFTGSHAPYTRSFFVAYLYVCTAVFIVTSQHKIYAVSNLLFAKHSIFVL